MEFRLPKLGEKIEFAQVVKVVVRVGDVVQKDQTVAELETDKAVVELPSSSAGIVKAIHIKEGEKIKIGAPVLTLEVKGGVKGQGLSPLPGGASRETSAGGRRQTARGSLTRKAQQSLLRVREGVERELSSPSRGITLPPSQRRGGKGPGPIDELLPDFSRWGPIERKPMSPHRLKTAQSMTTAWSVIPHVTQFDEADITSLADVQKKKGKPALTAIIVKISSDALEQYPQFNATVDLRREEIILKKYLHIGVAVDTERGLLVPVLRDADKKTISAIARELGELSSRAREKKLKLEEMEGASFTVTNLGGIGGSHFTPIIHYPEVAILGVGRAMQKPVWINGKWEPALVLPLSISYDHRVIDGADAARFLRAVAALLEKPESLNWDE